MLLDEDDIDQAYENNGLEDALRLYGDRAETYDEIFGTALGNIALRAIAAILNATVDPPGDVLDIGGRRGLRRPDHPGRFSRSSNLRWRGPPGDGQSRAGDGGQEGVRDGKRESFKWLQKTMPSTT